MDRKRKRKASKFRWCALHLNCVRHERDKTNHRMRLTLYHRPKLHIDRFHLDLQMTQHFRAFRFWPSHHESCEWPFMKRWLACSNGITLAASLVLRNKRAAYKLISFAATWVRNGKMMWCWVIKRTRVPTRGLSPSGVKLHVDAMKEERSKTTTTTSFCLLN